MDPVTIFELTNTVVGLSIKIYDFFKGMHDAPRDIIEYLQALDKTKAVFEEVQDYLQRHISSTFHTHDGLQLDIVQRALEDCRLEFALQLSFIEKLDPAACDSFFKMSVRKAKWVLSEEKIEAFTAKLGKVQSLLSVAIASTTGKNTVLIRDKLELVSIELHEVNKQSKAEAAAHDQLLQQLQQYLVVVKDSTREFLELAKTTHIRSDTRLEDLAQSLSLNISPEGDSVPATDSTAPAGEKGSLPSNDDASGTTADFLSSQQTAGAKETKPELSDSTLALLAQSQDTFREFSSAERFRADSSIASVLDKSTTLVDVVNQLASTADRQKYRSSTKARLSRLADRLNATGLLGSRSSPDGSGIYSSLKILLVASATSEVGLDYIAEAMTEMTDALQLCERETSLHQDPKLFGLVERLYVEILQCTHALVKFYSRSAVKRSFNGLGLNDSAERSMLEGPVSSIRRISETILREVDYRHRVEMRQTSSRIVEMQVEQRRMLSMLEDQKKLLQGMEEERKVMGVVLGQQEIVQAVQQLHRRLQAQADQHAIATKGGRDQSQAVAGANEA